MATVAVIATDSERLQKTRAQQWAQENAEAIKANNERVEREGLWHKGMTPWYGAEHG